MANLKLEMRWEQYVPKVAGNDKLPVPFYFELACGLTRAQVRKLEAEHEKLKEQIRKHLDGERPKFEAVPDSEREAAFDAWLEAREGEGLEMLVAGHTKLLEPYVKLGAEPLSLDGQPIRTIEQYLRACTVPNDKAAFHEPLAALMLANTLGGAQVVFSKRPSGGSTGTRSQANGSAGNQTVSQ